MKDRGGDYTKTAIPVSQTRAATGLPTDSSALDALDGYLEEDDAVATFRLKRGEMLWVDNCTTLHDRTENVDDAEAPRLLLRQWVK